MGENLYWAKEMTPDGTQIHKYKWKEKEMVNQINITKATNIYLPAFLHLASLKDMKLYNVIIITKENRGITFLYQTGIKLA